MKKSKVHNSSKRKSSDDTNSYQSNNQTLSSGQGNKKKNILSVFDNSFYKKAKKENKKIKSNDETTDNDTDNLSSNNNIANIPVKKKRQNYFDKFSMTNSSSFPWSFYQKPKIKQKDTDQDESTFVANEKGLKQTKRNKFQLKLKHRKQRDSPSTPIKTFMEDEEDVLKETPSIPENLQTIEELSIPSTTNSQNTQSSESNESNTSFQIADIDKFFTTSKPQIRKAFYSHDLTMNEMNEVNDSIHYNVQNAKEQIDKTSKDAENLEKKLLSMKNQMDGACKFAEEMENKARLLQNDIQTLQEKIDLECKENEEKTFFRTIYDMIFSFVSFLF